MQRHPKLIATLVFFAAAMLTFIAGMVAVDVVGNMTNADLVGNYTGLLTGIFLGSIPASLNVGILFAWFTYRFLSRPARS